MAAPSFAICLAIIAMQLSAISGQSACGRVVVVAEFNMTKFLGTWYEIEWISPSYENPSDIWSNYFHVYRADTFGIVTGYSSGKDQNTGTCYVKGLVLMKTKEVGKFRLYSGNSGEVTDYWVLATDYQTYAIVYSCLDQPPPVNSSCTQARSWTWSRTKSLPVNVKDNARNMYQYLCMNMSLLYKTTFPGEDCLPSTSGISSGCIALFVEVKNALVFIPMLLHHFIFQ